MDASDSNPIEVDENNDSMEEMELDESQSSQINDGACKTVQKSRKRTSIVWKYFEILPTKKPEDPVKCACKKCGKMYNASGQSGTGNLKRHIKTCPKMINRDIGQMLLANQKGLVARNSNFSFEKFRELIVQAVIRHDLPFSFVEYEGIRDVLRYLEPQVGHISRNTCRSDIKKMHNSGIERLRNELRECPSRICLTSDAWTSIVTDGYVSLTAHYIDQNWVLHKKILAFSYMPPPHNGVGLAEKIFSLASSWGIEKKLFAITLDNASVNDACVQILKNQLKITNSLVHEGKLFHVRCCAHILNLIVQDGLKEIDCAVAKVRECVKYIKGSQVRKQRFTKCVEQTSLDSKKALVQDVPTRWNSTYKMLSSALYYRLAFCHLQLSDSNLKSCPSDEEWEKVQKICDFLEIFHTATNAFSGSRYPTSNLYFPQVFLIQLKLVNECKSQDVFMKKMADQMFVKFNKYWCDFNLLLAVAVVFDPRYKFQFLEFSYNKLYGSGSAELKKVRDTLFALFDEYMTFSKASSVSPSSSRGTNKVQSFGEVQQSTDPLKEFDNFDSYEFDVSRDKSQLEMYLDEPRTIRTSTLDVLVYWKDHAYRYPDLSRLAMDILCVPVSTVASESAFSLGGRILDQYRSSLSPNIVEALICTRDWLFGERGMSTSINELIQDIMHFDINDTSESQMESAADSNSNVVSST